VSAGWELLCATAGETFSSTFCRLTEVGVCGAAVVDGDSAGDPCEGLYRLQQDMVCVSVA
jgi:hypothetical protein